MATPRWKAAVGGRLAAAAVERPGADLAVDARAEVGRDHGAEDGDREQAGDAGDAVVDAGGDPDVAFLDRVEHGRGQRRHRRREAEAEDEDRRQHVGRGSRRSAPTRSIRSRPTPPTIGPAVIGSRGPVPEARLPKRGESTKRMSEIGVVARPASQRRVAGDLLEEETDEEEAADQPRVGGERGQVGDREVADPEEGEVEHRVAGARLVEDEEREAGDPGDQRHPDHRVAPAVGRLLDQGEDRAAEARAPRARSRASRCRGRRRGRGSPRPSAGSAPR